MEAKSCSINSARPSAGLSVSDHREFPPTPPRPATQAGFFAPMAYAYRLGSISPQGIEPRPVLECGPFFWPKGSEVESLPIQALRLTTHSPPPVCTVCHVQRPGRIGQLE